MSFTPTLCPFDCLLIWSKRKRQCVAQLQLASWKPDVFHCPWLWPTGKTFQTKSPASINTLIFHFLASYQAPYKAVSAGENSVAKSLPILSLLFCSLSVKEAGVMPSSPFIPQALSSRRQGSPPARMDHAWHRGLWSWLATTGTHNNIWTRRVYTCGKSHWLLE